MKFIINFLAALAGKGERGTKAQEQKVELAHDEANIIIEQAQEEKRKLLLAAQEETSPRHRKKAWSCGPPLNRSLRNTAKN